MLKLDTDYGFHELVLNLTINLTVRLKTNLKLNYRHTAEHLSVISIN
jgi:hypothetical protein